MPVMVKALGYYSHKGGQAAGGLARLKSHLKYLEHGKVHEFKPRGFDERRDQVSREEFLARVAEQPDRGVIAHKLVFSLSQDERDRLGLDLRSLVRSTMDEWSRKEGRPLQWIGFQHEDKGHPHVHVVVAGYAGGKQVGLYPRDIERLRAWSERSKERLVERESVRRQEPVRVEADRVWALLERFLERFKPRDRGRERDEDRGR